ncbi:hypothetical protein HAX54_052761, partial [Datura stramonium]|nr:hypothetical protein [Datura stramonium]
ISSSEKTIRRRWVWLRDFTVVTCRKLIEADLVRVVGRTRGEKKQREIWWLWEVEDEGVGEGFTVVSGEFWWLHRSSGIGVSGREKKKSGVSVSGKEKTKREGRGARGAGCSLLSLTGRRRQEQWERERVAMLGR